jgi:hypothetical protein
MLKSPKKMKISKISELSKGDLFQIIPGSDWYEYFGFWGCKYHYMSFDGHKYESDEIEIFAHCSRFNWI